MNHYDQTINLWQEHKNDFQDRINDWAARIEKSKPAIKHAKNIFQKWKPLRFYTSVTKPKGVSSVVFSIDLKDRKSGSFMLILIMIVQLLLLRNAYQKTMNHILLYL